MTKEMLWFLMGHLVCIGQWAAFIMVNHAFLGRGRRFRFPCLLAAVFLAASIRHDIGFFNIGSVILNVIYLLVTVLFFGGSWNQKLSACLVNGIMCLLTENTVSYTFAWCKHIPVREVWRYRSCLFLLVAAVVGAGLLAAYIIRRWRREQALTPLQMLVMSFFPGIVVALNIVLMVSGGSEVPSMMNMMLTFGLTIAVLIHLGIVQMVNDQALDQLTESSYKLLRPAHPYNRGDNGGVIGFFVSDICLFRHQLFNDIGKFRRHLLSHLGTGVFGRNHLADLNQTVDGHSLPVVSSHSL